MNRSLTLDECRALAENMRSDRKATFNSSGEVVPGDYVLYNSQQLFRGESYGEVVRQAAKFYSKRYNYKEHLVIKSYLTECQRRASERQPKPFVHLRVDYECYREDSTGDYIIASGYQVIRAKHPGNTSSLQRVTIATNAPRVAPEDIHDYVRNYRQQVRDYLNYACTRISFEPDKISPVLDITDDMSLEDKIALALKPDHSSGLRQWAIEWTKFLGGESKKSKAPPLPDLGIRGMTFKAWTLRG